MRTFNSEVNENDRLMMENGFPGRHCAGGVFARVRFFERLSQSFGHALVLHCKHNFYAITEKQPALETQDE